MKLLDQGLEDNSKQTTPRPCQKTDLMNNPSATPVSALVVSSNPAEKANLRPTEPKAWTSDKSDSQPEIGAQFPSRVELGGLDAKLTNVKSARLTVTPEDATVNKVCF